MIDERVLFLLQDRAEAELASAAFGEAAIPLAVVPDVADLCREMGKGCGAAVITEDVFDRHGYGCILEVLRGQPSWSEIPLIVLVPDASRSTVRDFFADLPTDIILLEAPIRLRPLLSVAVMAVKGRKRQYLVRDAMRELHAARRQAEDATKAKSDFLADMTHDLRTPLSGIMGMLQLVT
ncbi:MAG TPA: histidine kinase dimerization/phospho-acceptor domain-containing protein, partial [Verrucomicrobiae bacterium]|nr:histidine kinase dimerization/phospho-acceptor domain-containing protein [Verrucomicrobiae bacterium]